MNEENYPEWYMRLKRYLEFRKKNMPPSNCEIQPPEKQ